MGPHRAGRNCDLRNSCRWPMKMPRATFEAHQAHPGDGEGPRDGQEAQTTPADIVCPCIGTRRGQVQESDAPPAPVNMELSCGRRPSQTSARLRECAHEQPPEVPCLVRPAAVSWEHRRWLPLEPSVRENLRYQLVVYRKLVS